MEQAKAEDLVRRIATAVRGADLYSPTHPLVQRGIDNLVASAQEALQRSASVIIGFIDDEIVVDAIRLPRGTAALVGFARDLREREIEKITITRGSAARRSARSSPRSAIAGTRRRCRISWPPAASATSRLGRVVVEDVSDEQAGISAARRVLHHRRGDGGDALGIGEGRRAARPRDGAQDHRRAGAAGDAGPHLADGAHRAQEATTTTPSRTWSTSRRWRWPRPDRSTSTARCCASSASPR